MFLALKLLLLLHLHPPPKTLSSSSSSFTKSAFYASSPFIFMFFQMLITVGLFLLITFVRLKFVPQPLLLLIAYCQEKKQFRRDEHTLGKSMFCHKLLRKISAFIVPLTGKTWLACQLKYQLILLKNLINILTSWLVRSSPHNKSSIY